MSEIQTCLDMLYWKTMEKNHEKPKKQVFWCEKHVFSSHLWFKSSLNHELSLQTSFQNRWPTNQRAQVSATKSMVVQVSIKETLEMNFGLWCCKHANRTWLGMSGNGVYQCISKKSPTKQNFAPTRTFAYIQITHSNNITFLSQEDEK